MGPQNQSGWWGPLHVLQGTREQGSVLPVLPAPAVVAKFALSIMYPLSNDLLPGSSTEVSRTYQSPCPEPVALASLATRKWLEHLRCHDYPALGEGGG